MDLSSIRGGDLSSLGVGCHYPTNANAIDGFPELFLTEGTLIDLSTQCGHVTMVDVSSVKRIYWCIGVPDA
jgi:hypothetical protein